MWCCGAVSSSLHLDVESDQAEGLFEFASRTHFRILHFYNVNNQALRAGPHLLDELLA
jgi:hypothetical protein